MIIRPFSMFLLFYLMLSMSACGAKSLSDDHAQKIAVDPSDTTGMAKAVFASGCFWCVEAIFESVEGVGEVISGYSGGTPQSANYRAVSSGTSKHAESVLVYYDPNKITYETLLTVFFDSHDPTTLNRQGPDYGFQYRSSIFYKDEKEKAAAEAKIKALEEAKVFKAPITTLLEPLIKFYPAEDYHQNYEKLHPDEPYIRGVSIPRLKRFLALHPELIKKSGL